MPCARIDEPRSSPIGAATSGSARVFAVLPLLTVVATPRRGSLCSESINPVATTTSREPS